MYRSRHGEVSGCSSELFEHRLWHAVKRAEGDKDPPVSIQSRQEKW